MHIATPPEDLFQSLQLLEAYEKAINANVISTITDKAGIIVYANEKFCEVSKYSLDAILGENHRIINSGHHSRDFFNDLWTTISQGHVWHGEIMNKASDGSFYWVDTVIVPIKDERERITHFLSLRMLITDRKKLEDKRSQYVSSLEVLLVLTSSNIKDPLSACVKQLDELKGDKPIVKDDLKGLVENLSKTVKQLDIFTHELSVFIREIVQ